MRVVVDTNIFLVSVSRFSPYHWLYECILNGKFELCVSTEILLEYEEKISEMMNSETAESTLDTLQNTKPVIEVNNYYAFNLIRNDYDDNKFSDCAFTSNADYLVTNDKHFDVLKNLEFPKINVVGLDEFKKILQEHKLID